VPTPTRLVPTATTQPTATPVPPTPTSPPPSPTVPVKPLGKATGTANVRSGPGTNYARLGQVQEGQEFEVTGRNEDGDWWQLSFEGKPGWVAATFIGVNEAGAAVAVVAEIPPSPVPAAPRPPAPAPPTQPPAPTFKYGAVGANPFPSTNNYVMVYCRVVSAISSKDTARTGTLRVTGPASGSAKFGSILHLNMPGTSMEFMYQENCKVQLAPFAPGEYTASIVDDAGNQQSDPIKFTAGGDQRDFLLIWNPR
jgi:hypothetical protein